MNSAFDNSILAKVWTYVVLLIATTTCWSQTTITGRVIFKEDKSSAAGVFVVDEATKNGTQTKLDGTFELTVNDPNATLVFTFIGAVPTVYKLKGETEILVELKFDCNKDFFDSRQVHIYVNSGVINNPLGGQIDLASPWIFRGLVKGSYSYQTNGEENTTQTGQVELAHYIGNCDFDLDFRWRYRQVVFEDNLDFKVNSFEADLSLGDVKLIAGYSHLDFTKRESADNKKLSGMVIGVGRYFNIPLYPLATLRVGLYKGKVEYQAAIEGGYRRFDCFVKYYKLNSFHELSVGVGMGFGY